eukprot:comp20631_c0_seq1/m.26702 comp20631_c0_seq1/g.26702  ORF comp20631_c0_seq1/g.26702 comp20631_c0_seq1/m.26702 type:complete len:802 (-) comp20631_c0_seq1:554-2959(-)
MFARVLAVAATAIGAAQASGAGVPYSLRMNTLVVYKYDEDKKLPNIFLEGYDTAYTMVTTVPDLTNPDYHSIVVTRSDIDDDAWAALRSYAAKYNVRIACLDSKPDNVEGVQPTHASHSFLTFDNSPYALSVGDVACTQCFWSSQSLSARPVDVSDPAAVKPFLRLAGAKKLVGTEPIAAAVINTTFGTEEMHFFFQAWSNELMPDGQPNPTQYDEHTKVNLALGNVWFQFITRGVYLGKRRTYIQIHVDDWFSATNIYKGLPRWRLDGRSAEFNALWAESYSKTLPAGSRIYIEPAFNGAGHTGMYWEKAPNVWSRGVGLNEMTNKYRNYYNWISHTWTHQNLDYLEPNECNNQQYVCRVPPNRVEEEIAHNVLLIQGKPVPVSADRSDLKELQMAATPGQQMFYNDPDGLAERFSRSCLVPPEISGIWPASVIPPENRIPKAIPNNTQSLMALYRQGIRTVTGDNSRPELCSKESKYHGIWMTPQEYGVPLITYPNGTMEGMMIIPRHAVNIFYDVNDPTSYVAEYTDLQACLWAPGEPCTANSYTFEAAIMRQSKATTIMWLSNRPDPFMFHQANLNAFNYNNRTVSLVSLWAELAIGELQKYADKIPIQSPTMEKTAQFYRERMYRDSCGINSYLNVGSDGKSSSISVKTQNSCQPVITITNPQGGVNPIKIVSDGLDVEAYGNIDTSYTVPMYPAKEKTLSLVGSAPSSSSVASSTPRQVPSTTVPPKQVSTASPTVSEVVAAQEQTDSHKNTVAIAVGVSVAVVCVMIAVVAGGVYYYKTRVATPAKTLEEGRSA